MGSLIIKKITYRGDNFFFVSPELKAGLNIVEGPNGSGKSTLMNFIYYGLSGKVEEFSSSNKNTHFEITNDRNNSIELDISISGNDYLLKRFINSSDITILDKFGGLLILPINRSKTEKVIFSDWILEKLEIPVVEVFQGIGSFKLNIKDLLRLIYHNQELNPRKIYKPEDSDNIIADSSVVRKIIFEILVGKTFSEYYETLALFKEAEKDRNISKGLLDEYLNIAKTLSNGAETLNIVHLTTQESEKKEQLSKLLTSRESLKQNRPSSSRGFQEISDLRTSILENELRLNDLNQSLSQLTDELLKLERLSENIILEVTQIKKIVHSHEKLNLFSADTCPYCLRDVDRKKGQCVCGAEIDENEYERFFYSSDEYLNILKSKQKSVETIGIAINSCNSDRKTTKTQIAEIQLRNNNAKERIKQLAINDEGNIDVSLLDKIDDKILNVRQELSALNERIEIENRVNNLQKTFDDKTSKFVDLKNRVKALEAKADIDIRNKVDDFNVIYNAFMLASLKNLRSAKIDYEDYMPLIDDGTYREASSSVSIRLMYYLSMLMMSLKATDVKFPKLLIIDTPETAGVDQENLLSSISQIDKILKSDLNGDFQIILTTGPGKYPKEFENSIILKLTDIKRLLISQTEDQSAI